MNYTPRKGGIADRAMAHLRKHVRVSDNDLASAIDADPAMLFGSMNIPVQHGLVLREPRGEGGYWYGVPGGSVVTAVDAPVNRLEPLANLEYPRANAEPRPQQEEPVSRVEYAMWSDGRLVIEFDDATYILTAADRKRLFDFVFLFEVQR